MAQTPEAAGPPGGSATSLDPSGHRLTEPEAILVFGAPRRALNLLAFGWANRVDRLFAWLEVGAPETATDVDSLAPLIPPERRLDVRDAHDLLPDAAASNLALFTLLRPESATDDLSRITDFLTLPLPVQELVSRIRQNALPGAIVITNVDRLASTLKLPAAEILHFLTVLKREHLTLIVTSGSETHPLDDVVAAFDRVYQVSDPGGLGWLDAQVGAAGGHRPPDLPEGRTVPLRRSPVYQEAIESVRLHDLRLAGQLSWRVPV
ncbi:MAG: hypothetical protein ACREDK_00870 [Thermoplasmata archaeon]